MILRSLIFCLFLYSAPLAAQFADCKYDVETFNSYLEGTTHVVLSGNSDEYNTAIKSYMDSQWEINSYDFVKAATFYNRDYIKAHENEFFLIFFNNYWAVLNSTPTMLIIQGKNLDGSLLDKNEFSVDPRMALAYFSIPDKGCLQLGSSNCKIPFYDGHVYLSMMALRSVINTRKEMFSPKNKQHWACEPYFKAFIEALNKPRKLRTKSILINEDVIGRIDESDLKKILRHPYKLTNTEEYYRIIREKDPAYAVLTSAMSSSRGFIISVLDLESGEFAYAYRETMGQKIKSKHIKKLNKTL